MEEGCFKGGSKDEAEDCGGGWSELPFEGVATDIAWI